MKTITIKQPWASLICTPRQDNPKLGIKDIENRTWPTKYRGRVLVHASAKPARLEFDIEGQASAKEIQISAALNHCEENNLFSAIIGSVEISDCVINHDSEWAEKTELPEQLSNKCVWNWVLANPVLFPEPIPAKGRLSFWEFELETTK